MKPTIVLPFEQKRKSPEMDYCRKCAKRPSSLKAVSLTANAFFVALITLYAMGYIHTSRTVTTIQPGIQLAAVQEPIVDYVGALDEANPGHALPKPSKPVHLTCHGKAC